MSSVGIHDTVPGSPVSLQAEQSLRPYTAVVTPLTPGFRHNSLDMNCYLGQTVCCPGQFSDLPSRKNLYFTYKECSSQISSNYNLLKSMSAFKISPHTLLGQKSE